MDPWLLHGTLGPAVLPLVPLHQPLWPACCSLCVPSMLPVRVCVPSAWTALGAVPCPSIHVAHFLTYLGLWYIVIAQQMLELLLFCESPSYNKLPFPKLQSMNWNLPETSRCLVYCWPSMVGILQRFAQGAAQGQVETLFCSLVLAQGHLLCIGWESPFIHQGDPNTSPCESPRKSFVICMLVEMRKGPGERMAEPFRPYLGYKPTEGELLIPCRIPEACYFVPYWTMERI